MSLLLSIVLYKYKDQGSFRLLTTNRHGHRHQLISICSVLSKLDKRAYLAIGLNRRRRTKKKIRGSFSFGTHSAIFILYTDWTLLVCGGDERITHKKKRRKKGEKWRRHRSSSTDGQVAPARNTIRYTCIHMHTKKKKKKTRPM